MDKTRSGFGILQLSAHGRGSGASFLSPAGAFACDQAASVAISASLRDGSFANFPTAGSANHGGITLVSTAWRIAAANERACSKVSNVIGAMEPARWQL